MTCNEGLDVDQRHGNDINLHLDGLGPQNNVMIWMCGQCQCLQNFPRGIGCREMGMDEMRAGFPHRGFCRVET